MIRQRLEAALRRLWFEPSPGILARGLGLLLAPLSLLTAVVARRQRHRIEALPPPRVPVVVIGNLVVGGAGKTPLVIAVARTLAERGWRPGIVASGYGAQRSDARMVGPDDPAEQAGDEALLLALGSGLPVAVGRRRSESLAVLLAAHPDTDVVVSDDGLQHAGLPRSLELAVFDRRGAGNRRLLPAGPLREPLAHLAGMDALLANGNDLAALAALGVAVPAAMAHFGFRIVADRFVRVDGKAAPLAPAAFKAAVDAARAQAPNGALAPGATLAAVAGIGEPQRLFDTLARLGVPAEITIAPGDHRTLDADALRALPARFVAMTTKDAVKCRPWADERCWALEVRAEPDPAFADWLDTRLREA